MVNCQRKFNNSTQNKIYFLFLALLCIYGCSSKKENFVQDIQEPKKAYLALNNLKDKDLNLDGQKLAQVYCGTCHMFPDPSLLTKEIWKEKVLPNMGIRLGLQTSLYDSPLMGITSDEIIRISNAGIYSSEPLIFNENWEKIVNYYLSEAPDTPLPQDSKAVVRSGLPHFKVLSPDLKVKIPSLTTLTRFNNRDNSLYIGSRNNFLLKFNSSTFQLIDSISLDSPPSDIVFEQNRYKILTMGKMDPSDLQAGKLIEHELESKVVLNDLSRPVHLLQADLNQNGLDDLIVSNFGNNLGNLSWYENLGNNNYQAHILRNMPGARKSFVMDLNKDGLPDIIALMTQGQEGVYAYYNQGNGKFKEESLLTFPPVYGSSDFQLIDFNGDGATDILYTNGDNADYSYSLKNYHGVRIFLNDGENNFIERWFYPMYGATSAIAADFNQNGYIDIAAISFFPDYENAPHESFLYFENKGNFNFLPYSFEESISGRWLTLDTGDIDQDGDLDVILGSYILGPLPDGSPLKGKWQEVSKPFLILKNQIRNIIQ